MEKSSFVAVSGGIDSTALALLEPSATMITTDTGWEFPELYAHLDRIEKVTGREIIRIKFEKYPGGIPQYIEEHSFFPNFKVRWCTSKFKILPMNAYLKRHLPAELLIGLRADEPDRVGSLTEMDGLDIRYPLRERGLTRLDCVRMCAEADLLPRYPVYMARGGCIGCFYKRKSEIRAMIQFVPEIVDQLQQLEEMVQDERGKFFHMFPNAGKSIAAIKAEHVPFTEEEVYAAAGDRSDMGVSCGLFCNR